MEGSSETQTTTIEICCPICNCNKLEWGYVNAFFTPDNTDPFWHHMEQNPDGVRSGKCTRCGYLLLFDVAAEPE